MDYFKFFLVLIVFLLFSWLIFYSLDIDETDSLKKENRSIPVIESDKKEFRVKFDETNEDLELHEDSCTLNNEC